MATKPSAGECSPTTDEIATKFETFGIQETEYPEGKQNQVTSITCENDSENGDNVQMKDTKEEFGNTRPLLEGKTEIPAKMQELQSFSGVMETQSDQFKNSNDRTQSDQFKNSNDRVNISQCSELSTDNAEAYGKFVNEEQSKGDNSCECNSDSDSDSDNEYVSAEEDDIAIDEQGMMEIEKSLTDEEKNERKKQAQVHKEEGNKLFREQNYKEAIKCYGKALRLCPVAFPKDRSIMYSNRAACWLRMEQNEQAIVDSTSALDLHPHYLKAVLRRAQLYEKENKLDESLADYQRVLELDPYEHSARAACLKLPDLIKERNEKMKEEMLGKLKDIGNMILRPFGLSTNNFQMQQNTETGGYSVNFQQNPNNGK